MSVGIDILTMPDVVSGLVKGILISQVEEAPLIVDPVIATEVAIRNDDPKSLTRNCSSD